jgi:hypothetical protein
MRMGMEILKLLRHKGQNKKANMFYIKRKVPLTREPTSKGDRIPIPKKASELRDWLC